MNRNTASAVPSTRPIIPLLRMTIMECDTEKNTSGTTSTNIKFRNSIPGARSTCASSPRTAPRTPPATSPSIRSRDGP